MIFEQLFDEDTSTYTYFLCCERTRQAVLIDPVLSEQDNYLHLLKKHNAQLVYTLETHVHADHVTAAASLRAMLCSRSVVHQDGGAACADVLVKDGDELSVGDLKIRVLHTPGHTNGCVSYVVDDKVFTGDALLIGGCGRTDFQQGDPGKLYDSIHEKLFSLPPETRVYPGHDYRGNTVSTIEQEMHCNERLGRERSRESFIQLMNNLKLDLPRHIHSAVPANQACGGSLAA
ncbi:MAG: MBL fold metallo-hydrolase [Methylococcaceae bacterium]|nr:MAG: MBL fold metallo-hydrolase [Methylococcaceae bacterium]